MWGWAIAGLALAYIVGLIIVGQSNGMEFLLALAAKR